MSPPKAKLRQNPHKDSINSNLNIGKNESVKESHSLEPHKRINILQKASRMPEIIKKTRKQARYMLGTTVIIKVFCFIIYNQNRTLKN